MGTALERRSYVAPSQEGLRAWRSPSRKVVVEGFYTSPPAGGIFSQPGSLDDWEEVPPANKWDHDHCAFCGATFEEKARVAARQPADTSTLTEGYVTAAPDADDWICDRCFEDFKGEFSWSINEPSTGHMDGPIPVRTLDEFRELVDSSRLLVITDTANGVHLHTDPKGCPHVREDAFAEKVLRNSEKNGAYFSVATANAALAEWPNLSACRSRACAAR